MMIPFSFNEKLKSKNKEQGYEALDFCQAPFNAFIASVDQCEPHWHSALELILVIKGKFRIVIEGDAKTYEAGGAVLISPNQIHSLFSEVGDSRFLTFQFSPKMISICSEKFASSYALSYGGSNESNMRAVWKSAFTLAAYYAKSEKVITSLHLSEAYRLLNVVGKLKASKALIPNVEKEGDILTVRKCINFVNENYMRQVSLSELSGTTGVSYSNLSRTFKRVSGFNFKDYLTLLRVSKAAALLRCTKTPITDIALQCGFNEHKALISAFKKLQNVTPSEYRKSHTSGLYMYPEKGTNAIIPMTLETVIKNKLLVTNKIEAKL